MRIRVSVELSWPRLVHPYIGSMHQPALKMASPWWKVAGCAVEADSDCLLTHHGGVAPKRISIFSAIGWTGQVYAPGGAPQASALALKSVISVLLRKIQDPNVPGGRGLMMGQELFPHSSAASVQDFVDDVMITSLVDGAVHRFDLANYNHQLALFPAHQIHRSGGE